MFSIFICESTAQNNIDHISYAWSYFKYKRFGTLIYLSGDEVELRGFNSGRSSQKGDSTEI